MTLALSHEGRFGTETVKLVQYPGVIEICVERLPPGYDVPADGLSPFIPQKIPVIEVVPEETVNEYVVPKPQAEIPLEIGQLLLFTDPDQTENSQPVARFEAERVTLVPDATV
jgi:hypothetical protein